MKVIFLSSFILEGEEKDILEDLSVFHELREKGVCEAYEIIDNNKMTLDIDR